MTTFRQMIIPFTLPLVAMLSACTNNQSGVDGLLTTGSVGKLNLEAPAPYPVSHSIARTVALNEALVVPDQRYAEIVEVSQTRFTNGVSQRIILEGELDQQGENWISAAISDGRKQAGQDDVLIVKSPTARSITARLNSVYGSRKMAINATSFSNSYGVFGTAHGRQANGHECHYGWQHLRPQHAKTRGILRRPGRKPQAMLMEVRMCQKGMGTEQFVAFMQGLQLNVPSDVLTARGELNWSSGRAFNSGTSPDLVGTGFAVPPAMPQPPAVKMAAARAQTPQVSVQRAAIAPLPTTTKPVRRAKAAAKPKTVTPKPVQTAQLPTVPTVPTPGAGTPDSIEPEIKAPNRIATSDVDKFPKVPLPR
ncbi:MAG: cellulose biosynthesis protein BcsN [Pseudomonadota bacterium]